MMSTTSSLLLLVALCSTTILAQLSTTTSAQQSTTGPSIPTLNTCTNGQIWVQNYIQFRCQVSGTSRAVIPIACVPSNTAGGVTTAPGTTHDDKNFRYTCNQTSANTMAYYVVACFDGDHRLLQVGQSSNSSDGYTYKCYLSSNQVKLSKTLLSYGCTSSTGQKYDLYQTWIQDGIYQMLCSAASDSSTHAGTAVQIACIYPPAANQAVPLNAVAVLQKVPLKCASNGSMYVLRNLTAAELQQYNSGSGGNTQEIGSDGGFGNGSDLIVPQPTTTTQVPTTTTTTTRAPTTTTTTTRAPVTTTTTTRAPTTTTTRAPTTTTTTTRVPTTPSTRAPTTTTTTTTRAPTTTTTRSPTTTTTTTTTTRAPTTTAAPTTTTTAAPTTEQVSSSTPSTPSTTTTTTSAPVQSGSGNCTDSFLFCSQLAPVCLGRSFKIFENVRQLLRSGNVSSQELVQAFDAAVQKSFSDEVSTTTTKSSLAVNARLLVRAFAGADSREEGCECTRGQRAACDCAPPAPSAPGCEQCRRFKARLLRLVRAVCPLTCRACDASPGYALPDLVQQLTQLYLTDCQSSGTASTVLPPPPDANRLLL